MEEPDLEVWNKVTPKVSNAMNDSLTKPYFVDEMMKLLVLMCFMQFSLRSVGIFWVIL